MSGIINEAVAEDYWSGFEAAHIFPLESESYWNEANYDRWITDMDDMTGVSRINSCQNGFLLRGDIHTDFNNYLVSVNPDVNELRQICYSD